MGNDDLVNYLKLIGAITALLTVALPTFYLTVVRPLLTQVKDLILALRENTNATDTSATALTELKPVVQANTVATAAIAGTGDGGTLTVNVVAPAAPIP